MDDRSSHSCGHVNANGQLYCGGCGSSLQLECPGCGAANPGGFRYCGSCGAALVAVSEPPPRPAGREERRWATVVFADLSGFTKFSEAADPEDVRALVDGCAELMGEVVDQHGGWFDKMMGDGLLAVFGAEVAHGDDPERAVRAALELRRISEGQTDAFGGLRLSIGVNTGEVMFAAVGPSARRTQTVLGDVVNTAARLQAAARPGSILVGEETWRATRGSVTYEEAEAVAAKGKQDPVPAWSAIDAAALDRGRPLSGVPLIGRDSELTMLERTWHSAVAHRRPHLVTLLGPAGMGKTKLAAELAGVVEAGGGRVIRGRSLPYGESTGYGAFALAVKDAVGLSGSEELADAVDVLRGAVRQWLPTEDIAEVVGNVATLIGFLGSSGADKQALFRSACRFVEALASDTPTAIIFEDVHWADPTLLELIETMAMRCRDVPLLLLALARPELLDLAPRWGGGVAGHTALTIDPLSEAESIRLAALHLGEPETSPRAVRLVAACDGNPLFIEELSASVVERATDLHDELPTSVRTIIAARIDALPPDLRALLLDAAVIGKVFWQGPLAELGHEDAPAILDALEGRDLIRRERRSQFGHNPEFTFRHILIRDVAYATLPRSARRRAHAAAAAFIEGVAADRAVELASTLAHHWREAGDVARAVDYLVAAAERAGGAWAAQEATQLYSDALELIDVDDPRRPGFRLARGLLLAAGAFYAEAVADLDAVMPDLTGRERAEALLARGTAAVWLMDGARAQACGEEALALADDLGQDDLRAPALSLISNGGAIDGRLEVARDLQQQSLAAWSPGVRQRQLADHLAMKSLTSYWVGAYDDAIIDGERSYELANEQQAVAAVLQGGSHLALALTGRGRHEEALQLFEKVAAQGRELEATPRLTSRTLNMMATALREVGDDREAGLRNQLGIEYASEADFGAARSQGAIDLLFADIVAGDIGRAESALPQIRSAVESLAGWHQWLALGRLAQAAAEIALARNAGEAAVTASNDALHRARTVGRLKYEALGLDALARSLAAVGRPVDAVRAAMQSVEAAGRLLHPPTSWRTQSTLARLLHAAGDDEKANTAAVTASSLLEQFAGALTPFRRETFLAALGTVRTLDSLRSLT